MIIATGLDDHADGRQEGVRRRQVPQRDEPARHGAGAVAATAPTAACCAPPTARSRSRSPTCSAPGSRDRSIGVPYCSRVCCMYALKQALLLTPLHPRRRGHHLLHGHPGLRQGLRAVLPARGQRGGPGGQGQGGQDHGGGEPGPGPARRADRRRRAGRGAPPRPGRPLPGAAPRLACRRAWSTSQEAEDGFFADPARRRSARRTPTTGGGLRGGRGGRPQGHPRRDRRGGRGGHGGGELPGAHPLARGASAGRGGRAARAGGRGRRERPERRRDRLRRAWA